MSDPITREETFLAAAAGDAVTLPKPITRVEQYLKRIAERTGGGGPDSPQNAALTFTGAVSATYDGSAAVSVEIPSDEHINSLISTALGVIENGTY